MVIKYKFDAATQAGEFSLQDPEGRGGQPQPGMRGRPCAFFAQRSGCRKGASCLFLHAGGGSGGGGDATPRLLGL